MCEIGEFSYEIEDEIEYEIEYEIEDEIGNETENEIEDEIEDEIEHKRPGTCMRPLKPLPATSEAMAAEHYEFTGPFKNYTPSFPLSPRTFLPFFFPPLTLLPLSTFSKPKIRSPSPETRSIARQTKCIDYSPALRHCTY